MQKTKGNPYEKDTNTDNQHPVLTITLFFIAGYASADAWPAWKGDEYYNDTFTDPFQQKYWSTDFTGNDHYTFRGDTAYSLAGKWINLELSEDVSIYVLRAEGGDHTASYTVNLNMNGKNLTSTFSGSSAVRWRGGVGADPGAVLNVTNSSQTASILTWNALYVARNSNTRGTININGTNLTLSVPTTQLNLGYDGKGTLNVTGGAALNITPALILGPNESGVGVINVSGNGSVVTSSSIYAWNNGSGTITVKNGASWYLSGKLQLGRLDYPGYGTMQISGTNSLVSASSCEINGAKLTIADGGHFEVLTPSASYSYQTVTSNGTVRLDNGTAKLAGRWNLKSEATLEFVLKNARSTPFIEVTHDEIMVIDPDAHVTFEMDLHPDFVANDFIPLIQCKAYSGTFKGFPDGHEFSVPYRNYEYRFRINYNLGLIGDRTMGLTVLGTPPRGTLIMIQ